MHQGERVFHALCLSLAPFPRSVSSSRSSSTRISLCDIIVSEVHFLIVEITHRRRVWLESIILVCRHCLSFCHLPDHRQYHGGETHLPVWVPGTRCHYHLSP